MNLTGKIIDRSKYNFIYGIDPGVNTGFAVYFREFDDKIKKNRFYIESTSIHKAIISLDEFLFKKHPSKVLVRIEDANTWKPFRGVPLSQSNAKLQGAGSVKRDVKIWIDFFEDYGIDYELVSLQSNLKKLSAIQFKKITGYTCKTNEHSRDAGMLVWKFFD